MSILYPNLSGTLPINSQGSTSTVGSSDPQSTGESFEGQWLLADSETGQTMLTFTSFIEAAIKRSGSVVAEPIEKGSFATYNKTTDPLNAIVTLGITGTKADILNAIDALTELQTNTVTFSFVSPVKEFENLTLETFSWKWERVQAADVLYVELSLVEIREVETLYTDTTVISSPVSSGSSTGGAISEADAANPSDASTEDTGMINTETPTEDESKQVRQSMMNKTLGVVYSA